MVFFNNHSLKKKENHHNNPLLPLSILTITWPVATMTIHLTVVATRHTIYPQTRSRLIFKFNFLEALATTYLPIWYIFVNGLVNVNYNFQYVLIQHPLFTEQEKTMPPVRGATVALHQ